MAPSLSCTGEQWLPFSLVRSKQSEPKKRRIGPTDRPTKDRNANVEGLQRIKAVLLLAEEGKAGPENSATDEPVKSHSDGHPY